MSAKIINFRPRSQSITYGTSDPRYIDAIQTAHKITTNKKKSNFDHQQKRILGILLEALETVRDLRTEAQESQRDFQYAVVRLNDAADMADHLIRTLHEMPIPDYVK